MKLEIDDVVADAILLGRLRDDYRMLIQDIVQLQSIHTNDLLTYQLEDLQANRKYAMALEVVLEYYSGPNWSAKI